MRTNWNIYAVGDYNGDMTADLALKRDGGLVYIWNLTNGAVTDGQYLGLVGSDRV